MRQWEANMTEEFMAMIVYYDIWNDIQFEEQNFVNLISASSNFLSLSHA